MKPTDTGHLMGVHTPRTNNPGNQVHAPESTPRATDESRDKVTLTSEARQVQQLQSTLERLPDVDQHKVDAIKAAIADGSFEIDGELIADRLVDLSRGLKS